MAKCCREKARDLQRPAEKADARNIQKSRFARTMSRRIAANRAAVALPRSPIDRLSVRSASQPRQKPSVRSRENRSASSSADWSRYIVAKAPFRAFSATGWTTSQGQ